MKHLTTSYVIYQSHLSTLLLQQKDLAFENPSPYYLVIYSLASRFMKILIYPVNTRSIRKYLISGKQIERENLEELINHLSSWGGIIIHTSGIVYRDDFYLYEIYFTGLDNADLAIITKKIRQLPGIDYLYDSLIDIKE